MTVIHCDNVDQCPLLTGYVVRCRLANQTNWRLFSTDLSSIVNDYTITGLTAQTVYHVDVAAKTRIGIGESIWLLWRLVLLQVSLFGFRRACDTVA